MGLSQTVLVRIWEIYYWKFERFTKNALTRSIFELEKCSFFLNGSEFRQKLIGTITSAVFPTKWATTRHFWWTLMFSLIGPSALPQCSVLRDQLFCSRPRPRLVLISIFFQDQYQDKSWNGYFFETNTKTSLDIGNNSRPIPRVLIIDIFETNTNTNTNTAKFNRIDIEGKNFKGHFITSF